MSVSASQATLVVDATTQRISGTTYLVDDIANQARFVNSGANIRWSSTPQFGTGTTIASGGASTDYYFQVGSGTDLLSGAAAIPVTARYAEVKFSLTGTWSNVGAKDDQLFLLSTGQTGTGSSTPTGQGNLPSFTNGSHTVIFDLYTGNAAPGPGTDWAQFRWDFLNDANNDGGKTITVNSLTYATAIAPIPEPTSVALLGLGALGLLVRRRR